MLLLSLYLVPLFCIVVFGALQSNSSQFSAIVAFGDSFTDNGNGSWKISNHTWPSNPAYYNGRFSNGPVWVEDVAANLSVPLYDYAYGSATSDNNLVQGYTGYNSTIPVPGVAQQLTTFLSSNASLVDFNTTLFVIFGGYNDIFFNENLTAATIAGAISGSVLRLIDSGALHILMLNYYDASQSPYDTYADLETKNILRRWSYEFGRQLAALAQGYQSQLAGQGNGGTVTYVDFIPQFRHWYFYGEPTSWGYDKYGAYGSCLTGAYGETANTTLCSNAGRRVFWDEYHPTRKTHQLLADHVLKALPKQSS